MWKKVILTALICGVLFTTAGCGKRNDTADTEGKETISPEHTYESEPSEEVKEIPTAQPEVTEEPDSTSSPVNSQETADVKETGKELSEVTLYLPDENAEYFIPSKVNIERTPKAVVQALVEAKALPEGTVVDKFMFKESGKAISFEDAYSSKSKKLTAEMDLSKEFLKAMQETGTTGEVMMMGSLVNSLTDCFHLKSIMVYGNGEIIETGHSVYDEPLSFYKEHVKQ